MDKILIDKEVNYIMSGDNKNLENKTCLTQLLQSVSKESNVELSVVKVVYKSMIKNITKELLTGHKVGLTGFGSFYLQKHKGHPVQFDNKKSFIDDYNVVKFTASGPVKKMVNDFAKK